MTVSSSTNRVSYSGNGSLTAFAYTFKVFDEDDLTVILRASNGTETVQTITTHYTVSGVGDAGGGNVTFTTAPASGVTVVILREQPLTQGLDLVPNDPFPAQSLEDQLDKLTFITQQHSEELGRTIKASKTNVITGAEFTISASDRANKVFAFDSSGDVSITSELGVYRGNWAAGVAYNQRDLVKDSSNDNIYLANTAHTSSGSTPLSSNADIAKWDLIVNAAAAASSASAAATSATAAQTAQTAAETAQTASETAQTASETAQTASETAKTASETAQAATELVYDNFDDRYLGAKSTSGGNPTVDNDGDALIDGALFFDTTNNVMMVYNLGTTTWLRTTPTTSDQADITTLAGIDTDIQALADIEDGTSATNALSNAGNASTEIVTVAGQISPTNNISTVAGLSSDISTVSGISANVTSVAGVSTDVTTVAGQISPTNNLSTVAGIASNVSTVAGISSDVTTTAGLSTDIGTLADIEDGTTATNAISNVGNNTANITTVAGQISPTNNISSLAAISSEISSVGGSISNVNIVATNLSSINTFANQYVVSASTPSSPNEGLLWFDTSTDTMKVYNGGSFQNAGSSVNGTSERVDYVVGTASGSYTGSTTAFPATYDPTYLDVFLNGVRLDPADYTATDGSTVTLSSAASSGDTLGVVAYGTFVLADHYSKTTSDARYAALSGATFTGDVSGTNVTLSGYLRGPSTFTIDPAAHGDNTGTLVIAGNLQVDGTTTTVNSTTMEVDDLNITVASGAANAAAANGAGITVDGASATFNYASTGDKWTMNKPLEISGQITADNITYDIVSTAVTVEKNTRNACDVSSAAFTMTLPTGPATGDFVEIRQIAGDFSVNNLTVAGNGNNINGDTSLIVDVAYAQLALIYNGTEWRVS